MVKTSKGPEGEFLDAPSNKWIIGKQLGTGACGFVHELTKVSSSSSSSPPSRSSYAVKLAPLPPQSNTKSKGKKRKKTPAERNAALLVYENTLYRNVLNDLRGNAVPDVPIVGSLNGFGDMETGYRYLVMERMEAPLSSIIPNLLSSSSSSSNTSGTININLGIIATSLITLLEKIHETRHVYVDVKPENFMFAFPSSSSSKKSNTNKKHAGGNKSKSTDTTSDALLKEMASRLRLIDFGLLESFTDITSNGHRVDEHPNGNMVGTPLYASCNVLEGHTCSRRDDLEGCGYVVCELVLQLLEYGRSGVDVKEDLLPWSKGTSDRDILEKKEGAVFPQDGKDGPFWKSLSEGGGSGGRGGGNRKYVAGVLKNYFDEVTNLSYKEKPDYGRLRTILSKLKVSVTTIEDGKAKESLSDGKKKRTRRLSPKIEVLCSDSDEDEDEEVESVEKVSSKRRTTRNSARAAAAACAIVAPSSPRKTTRRTSRSTTYTEEEEEEENIGNDRKPNSRKVTATTMKKPSSSSKKARKKRVTRVETITTTVEIIDSSNEEDSVDEEEEVFEEAVSEHPTNHHLVDVTQNLDKVDPDSDIEMQSAIEYKSDHNTHEDLNGSYLSCHTALEHAQEIYDEDVAPMEIDMDFVEKENDVASLNASVSVPKNDDDNRTTPMSPPKPEEVGLKDAKSSTTGATKKVKKKSTKKLALILDCVEGPHKGESIVLDDTITFGSGPRAQKKYLLDGDDDVSLSHAKFALNTSGSKGKTVVLSVRVTDLKSSTGTFVNGKKIPKGGGRQAFVGNKIKIGESIFQVKKA